MLLNLAAYFIYNLKNELWTTETQLGRWKSRNPKRQRNILEMTWLKPPSIHIRFATKYQNITLRLKYKSLIYKFIQWATETYWAKLLKVPWWTQIWYKLKLEQSCSTTFNSRLAETLIWFQVNNVANFHNWTKCSLNNTHSLSSSIQNRNTTSI